MCNIKVNLKKEIKFEHVLIFLWWWSWRFGSDAGIHITLKTLIVLSSTYIILLSHKLINIAQKKNTGVTITSIIMSRKYESYSTWCAYFSSSNSNKLDEKALKKWCMWYIIGYSYYIVIFFFNRVHYIMGKHHYEIKYLVTLLASCYIMGMIALKKAIIVTILTGMLFLTITKSKIYIYHYTSIWREGKEYILIQDCYGHRESGPLVSELLTSYLSLLVH